jgi:hypothetical protein
MERKYCGSFILIHCFRTLPEFKRRFKKKIYNTRNEKISIPAFLAKAIFYKVDLHEALDVDATCKLKIK